MGEAYEVVSQKWWKDIQESAKGDQQQVEVQNNISRQASAEHKQGLKIPHIQAPVSGASQVACFPAAKWEVKACVRRHI